jgi:PKD repeat protein
MEDYGASGVLQWGFMAGNENFSGDACRGMDSVHHKEDWDELYHMYQTFACTYTGAQPPLDSCKTLDLAFVVDTTGSMGDDIAAVKAAAADIVGRLTERGVNYRIGIVTFNDPASLTQVVLPFSADQPTIVSRLNSLSAGGGADDPETVYSGLMAAVGKLAWRSNVPRALILMGDAPPKDPEPDTGYTLAQVTAAAKAGRIGVSTAAAQAGLLSTAAPQPALTPDSIRIYPVLIGSDPSARQSFQALADQTGGSLFGALSASTVVAAILQAVDELTLAPVADAGGPYSGVVGQAITLDGSRSRDSDGAIVEYAWDVNSDGAPDVRSAQPTAAYTPTQVYSGSVQLQVTDNDGRTGLARANIAIAPPALRLPALSATSGQIVRVPVYVDTPVSGLAAASLTVQFDSRVLRPHGALAYPGSLTPGWALAANDRVAGRLRVALASPGAPASGAGTLAELEFEVLGGVGSSSPLQIARAALNDGAIPASAQSGSLTVEPPRYQITVKAVHATTQSPLANTTARTSGATSATCLTGASGTCTLANLLSSPYTVALTKTDEVGGIGSMDASLILQHDSGSRVLTGAAFTAGDVSGDGQVTAQDANLVLAYVSGTASLPFPVGKVWAFTPLRYTLLTQNQQPSVPGVLIGDVSGHLPAGTLALRGAAERTGALRLVGRGGPDAQGYRTLQLWFEPGQEGLLSLAATLRFDPALVTDVQVQPDKPAGALAAAQTRPDGQVRLALAAARPLGAGALLTLRYRSSVEGGWSLAHAEPNQDGRSPWQTPAGAGWRLFVPRITR